MTTIPANLARYFVRPVDSGKIVTAIELYHSALAGVPIRVCNDGTDRDLPIEAGAPHNPGTTQTFVRYPLTLSPGVQRSDSMPEMQLSVGDMGLSFRDLLLPILDGAEAPTVTWREYGGTVAAPVLLIKIYELTIRRAVASASAPSAYVLHFKDLNSLQGPRMRYDPCNAPGLIG